VKGKKSRILDGVVMVQVFYFGDGNSGKKIIKILEERL